MQLLQSIGAMDEEQVLSPLGYHLAKLPVPPKVSATSRVCSAQCLFKPSSSCCSSFFHHPFALSQCCDMTCRVQVGKMLLWAVLMRCLEPIATIAACLSFKDPFVCPLHKQVFEPCFTSISAAVSAASLMRSMQPMPRGGASHTLPCRIT